MCFGQDKFAVPDMGAKLVCQVAGLGFGFLPKAYASAALGAGQLVEKQVVEPRAPEPLFLAWRIWEEGRAPAWWRVQIKSKCNEAGAG